MASRRPTKTGGSLPKLSVWFKRKTNRTRVFFGSLAMIFIFGFARKKFSSMSKLDLKFEVDNAVFKAPTANSQWR